MTGKDTDNLTAQLCLISSNILEIVLESIVNFHTEYISY